MHRYLLEPALRQKLWRFAAFVCGSCTKTNPHEGRRAISRRVWAPFQLATKPTGGRWSL